MGSNEIILVCFDINSVYEESSETTLKDNEKNETELKIDSPIRIIDDFLETHLFVENEKKADNECEIKYKIKYKISKSRKKIISVYVLNDLTFIHQICYKADGYVFFINIESENSLENLEKLMQNIKENYAVETKIYMVGIFKEKMSSCFSYEKIESFFKNYDYSYNYYQIKYDNLIKNKNGKDVKETLSNTIDIIFKDVYDIYTEKNTQEKNMRALEDKAERKKDRSFCFVI